MARHFTLAAFAAIALGASAAVPFQVTTVTNGEFAPDTKWYTMQIHGDGYYISPVDDQGTIKLNKRMSLGNDSDLWCFTGSDAAGYTIYNKAMGAGRQLAAPTPLTGDGGSNLVSVKEPGASGTCYIWDFENSESLAGKTSFYISQHGNSAAAMNRRGENLAFWNAGKDGGSSVQIKEYIPHVYTFANGTVNLPDNATLACEGGTATIDGSNIALGAGTWTFSAPEGNFVLIASYGDENGNVTSKELNFYTNEKATISGPATIASPRTILMELPESGHPIFLTNTASSLYSVTYRIPSICTVEAGEHKGRLFSVNDYRYSGADIGSGRIDLYMTYSDDNGKTWSVPDHMRNAQGNPVAQGTGAATPAGTLGVESNLDCGFGDPASVSDRETGEILVIACCGRKNFWAGRRNDPQPSARWWSKDGGKTWTEPDYGQWEQIYALFDGTCANGYIDSQFVGSGRMVQSKYIKVGSHYRIYCVMSGYHNASGNVSNWVLYSDDFGHNWHILGGGMKPGVSSGADEPKCEELPDGSVLLAARGNAGNRNFNIFRYTDIEKAEGDWGNSINTNLGKPTGGTINACNGEIMILPVKEKATGTTCYLALQSYPDGPGRANVSIAWQPLKTGTDFDSPEDFRTWAGFYQVSKIGSLYSTMTWQHDNKVGFLFEENTYSGGQSEIYRALTIEEITGGAYEYCEDTDGATRIRLTDELLKARVAAVPAGTYVGMSLTGTPEKAKDIAEGYAANPTYDSVVAFNKAMQEATDIIKPENGKTYQFISPVDGTYSGQKKPYYLNMAKSNKKVGAGQSATSATTLFIIEKATEDGDIFYLYNPNAEAYVAPTADTHSQSVGGTTDKDAAGKFAFQSDIFGNTAIVCTNAGTAGYAALHLNSSYKVVNWSTSATKSLWNMTIADDQSAISEVGVGAANAPAAYFDLQGRPVASPQHGQIYVTSDRRKVLVK